MDDRRIEILMEMIRRRREERAGAQVPPAESKRNINPAFIEMAQNKLEGEEGYNPFRMPQKPTNNKKKKKKKGQK
jgi:hypothetical protein